jgi:hypothetical protein
VKAEFGVMLMKDGRAWGKSHDDGFSTHYDWIDPVDAPIHDPCYCTKPSDVTYEGSPNLSQIESGVLVQVVRVTCVEIIPKLSKEEMT